MRFLFFSFFFCSAIFLYAENEKKEFLAPSSSQMFSLSPEEMVFASKLSDENRHRFCYKFSLKERLFAMKEVDQNLSPNERVEYVFTAYNASLKSKESPR